MRGGKGIVYFRFGDRSEVWCGLVEVEDAGEDCSTWVCLWGYDGRETCCFGQRGWVKEIVGFVLAFMRAFRAWISCRCDLCLTFEVVR